MSDVRWGILGAAKFAREFMGPALTLAPGGHVAALATSDPAKADPFRADMGGGGLRDIGVYVMGGARFATGREATDVRARIQWEDGVDVYAAITAKFGDADDVNFTSIRMHPRQEITFHGDAEVLRLPVPFNARVFGEARLELHRGTETITERWPAVNHYELQAAAFNRAVRDGEAYPCTLEFSRGTQVMMDAAFASAA